MNYKVKAGDTLSTIAKRNGISLAQLLKANPQIRIPTGSRSDSWSISRTRQPTQRSHFHRTSLPQLLLLLWPRPVLPLAR